MKILFFHNYAFPAWLMKRKFIFHNLWQRHIYCSKTTIPNGAALKQILKKRILSCLLILSFLCLTFSACNAPAASPSSSAAQKEQRSFDDYTAGLFVKELQQNTINLHYTLSDPEKFGIKSHKISLGSLSKEDAKSSTASLENIAAALSRFDFKSLTDRQRLTCDILNDFCEKNLSSASRYYYDEPLRPTTGMHSELPILLAEYAFYDSCDVTDYLALLTCIEDYFKQIILFEQEKSKEGLFMSDQAADTVIEACKTFIQKPKKNFLIVTFDDRIDSVSELTEEKRELYKKQNRSLVKNIVIPAYKELIRALTELKGSGTNNAGLCHFPQGKEHYENLVRSNTGSDKSIKELQNMTERRRNLDMTALHELLARDPSLLESDNPRLAFDSPEEMLDHLLQEMQIDFYPAANDTYSVNYVHKSLEETLAPAFYLTAPIDDISHNVIYLNERSGYSGIQLFTTLAHEGYPGHLYQTIGSYQAGLPPILALLNYPGYVEGWATYVEMLSYRYAGLSDELAEMLMRNQSALLSLYASVDMGIHYDGWELADAIVFLKKYGITDRTVVQNMYKLIVEEPSHYLKYYIGYLEFLELKDYAKEIFADDYTDRDFHQAVVRIGPAPFPILKKYIKIFYYVPETKKEEESAPTPVPPRQETCACQFRRVSFIFRTLCAKNIRYPFSFKSRL